MVKYGGRRMSTFDLFIKAKKELDEICTHDNYVKAREQYEEQVKQLTESEVEE